MGPKPKKQSDGKGGKSKKAREKRLRAEAQLQAEREEAERLERERLLQEHLKNLEAKYQEEKESELAKLKSLEKKFLYALQWKMDYREQAKWERYLSCDGTPDPTIPQEINTFMSLWHDNQDEDVQVVMEKEKVVLNLIEKLESLLLETSPDEITQKRREQYQEFILQLQDLLHKKYNEATQNLLKTASMYEDSETGNMHTAIKDENSTFCIWVNLKKKARFKSHVFQEAGHGFDLPKSLALSSVAIRVLHTRYDHVSPLWVQCQGLPRQEASDSQDLAEHPKDTGQEPGGEEEEGREEPSLSAAAETSSKAGEESAASLKEKSNDADDAKETEEETEKNSDVLDVPSQGEEALQEAPRAVDPQQLVPLGGVYHIDALQLPPQPQDVGDWSMVQLLDIGLEMYPYSPGEAEDGTQEAVQITLRLPDNVIYFQVPVVARWEPAGQQWRTDGISNITYEAEEKSISFQMGAFCPVALLQDAHLNLPYQAWELHPTGVDEGLFTVTAVFATIQIQIKVREHLTAGSPEDNNWSLYMFSGEKVQNLKLTETSEAFSEDLEEESEFHSTLYHMLKDTASNKAMDKVEGAGFLFIDSVYQLLHATRVLAFS
ncbi:dynein axonemal intermediate chain 7 isoform X2 [Oenanthe melanoleuca]|uniref:dynein axonemal intermediate chain 7 isoform X2 n=1 Tax=Oenanthe melanoleuca TaxID=2939378 RepID=UPI0024C188E5|nr:dynein axonemal intermediate chain 7 isoform X2 [Oenanthe melanoleuca]